MRLNLSRISLKKIFGSSSILILLSTISTIAVVFYEGEQKVVNYGQWGAIEKVKVKLISFL